MKQFFRLASALATVSASAIDEIPAMVKTLDDMQIHYKGEGAKYDRVFLKDLTQCLEKWDDGDMLKSQNAAWAGIDSYWLTNGTDHYYQEGHSDHWGECSIHNPNRNCGGNAWLRNTPEVFGSDKILVYEPCNYVSNVAYYHSANRVCTYPDFASGQEYQKALKRGFASLTIGSAMMHESFTRVGGSFDCNMISVIAYLAHQISTQNIPCDGDCNPNILKELGTTKRNTTSIEFMDELTRAFIEKPTSEWGHFLNNGDYPQNLFLNFGCLVSTVANVMLPAYVADKAIQFLTSKLLAEAQGDFVYNQYNPQIAAALVDIKSKLPHSEIIILSRRACGMIMKIAYAFAFQEEMPPIPFLWKPVPNEMGALLLPSWNKLADHISGVPQLDEHMKQSMDVYPGDFKCRGYSPHALWHEESANGLLEITLLADYFNGLVIKYTK